MPAPRRAGSVPPAGQPIRWRRRTAIKPIASASSDSASCVWSTEVIASQRPRRRRPFVDQIRWRMRSWPETWGNGASAKGQCRRPDPCDQAPPATTWGEYASAQGGLRQTYRTYSGAPRWLTRHWRRLRLRAMLVAWRRSSLGPRRSGRTRRGTSPNGVDAILEDKPSNC